MAGPPDHGTLSNQVSVKIHNLWSKDKLSSIRDVTRTDASATSQCQNSENVTLLIDNQHRGTKNKWKMARSAPAATASTS